VKNGLPAFTEIYRKGKSEAGPHSDALHVIERFHRASRDILELTVTIGDPKMYTKPWVAADKLTLHLLPPDVDMGEMLCSPSEMSKYKKVVANPISGSGK